MDGNRESIGLSGAGCRQEDPIREAALLVGVELWDSTRARLYEGRATSVLVSSQRNSTGSSDVSVMVIAAGPLDDGEPILVTLAGAAMYTGRLDARGGCVIRDVPDGRYRIDIRRESEREGVRRAAILALPID